MSACTTDGTSTRTVRFLGAGAALITAVGLAGGPVAGAEPDPASELDELIVTGFRSRPLARVPRSTSVITARDIEFAPSTNLVELLAREANVDLRSFTGNDRFGAVDVRGMGDTSVSNVLVVVDGIRLNAADLSGPDFTSLALSQIERIEILRGANAVRYGNGAVGGVINIITRRDTETPAWRARASGGSFATREADAGFAAAGEAWSLQAGGAWSDTEGYRDNGALEREDVSAYARVEPFAWLAAGVGIKLHDDSYGLPGPVSAEDFADDEDARRATAFPEDGGTTSDDRVRADMELDLGDAGRTTVRAQWRDRDNRFIVGFTPLLPRDEQQGRIREDDARFEAVHALDFALAGRSHRLSVGAAANDTDYARSENGTGLVDRSRLRRGRIDGRAWFAALEVDAADRLSLSAGFRRDSFRIVGRDEAPETVCDFESFLGLQVPVNCRPELVVSGARDASWRNDATELGLVFGVHRRVDLFVSWAESFRNPNVDELVLADVDLGPQTAEHWDAGMRVSGGRRWDLSLAGFFSETDAEILFSQDPDSQLALNRNADQAVRRTGLEAEGRWSPADGLTLRASLGLVDAVFADSDARVPLVPRINTAVSAEWRPVSRLTASAVVRHVGERYDGNDFSNRLYPEVDAYTLVDLKLVAGRFGGWSVFAGVNNLFDEVYATSVYSGSFYPMSGRSAYVGFAYSSQ